MLFFPVWKNELGDVQFFQPVFNIADTAISVGVASILLFQRHYFNDDKKIEPTPVTETTIVENAEETISEAPDTEGVVENTVLQNGHDEDNISEEENKA